MNKQQNKETLDEITNKYENYKELSKNLKTQVKVLEKSIDGIKDENLRTFYSRQLETLKIQLAEINNLKERYSCKRWKLASGYLEKMKKDREDKNKLLKTSEPIFIQKDKPEFLAKYEMLEKVYKVLDIKIGDIFRTNFISKNIDSNCWIKATREGLIDISTGYYFHTLLGHLIGNPRVKITEKK